MNKTEEASSDYGAASEEEPIPKRSPSMIDDIAERRVPAGSILEAEGKSGNFGLNGKLFMKFVFWWLLTVPAAFVMADVIELVTRC